MTLKEAIKNIPNSSRFQPEGREVADAYRDGTLQNLEQCIYLIAFLLHQLNLRDAKQPAPAARDVEMAQAR